MAESAFWSALVGGAIAASRRYESFPSVVDAMIRRRDSDDEYVLFQDTMIKNDHGIVASTYGDFVLTMYNPHDTPNVVHVTVGSRQVYSVTLSPRERRPILHGAPLPLRALTCHVVRVRAETYPLTIVGMYLRADLCARMDAVETWAIPGAMTYITQGQREDNDDIVGVVGKAPTVLECI